MIVTGNIRTLFSMHGDVVLDNCIKAIEAMSDISELVIDSINAISETGGLYIGADGEIFDNYTKDDETRAKYKIVPTGLKYRNTDLPLFASFIKEKGMWTGAYIGTAQSLFEMYMQHYDQKKFKKVFNKIFCGNNRKRDIVGFGLSEVLNNWNNDIDEYKEYLDKNSETNTGNTLADQLAVALTRINNKIENDTKNNSKQLNKAQRKAQRLKKHLEKVKENEEKKKKQEEMQHIQEEIDSNIIEIEFGIIWKNVIPMEEVNIDFEDDATKEFLNRLEQEKEIAEEEEKLNNTSDNLNIAKENDNKLYNIEEDEDDEEMHNDPEDKLKLKVDLINTIYDSLLIKENWRINNKNRLGFYIKGIFKFVYMEQICKKTRDNIKGNGYTYSQNKKTYVVNTGLINKYGNYIYLVDKTPEIQDFYNKDISIMKKKLELISYGFNPTTIKELPNPIKFVENNEELIFDADYNNFDFNDTDHLYHIITERIDRFPEKYRSEPALILCDRIKSAIRQAIMIQKSDYKYIVPKYDFSKRKIQFMIPLRLDGLLDNPPEIVIIVDKSPQGFWNIFTILSTDDAYDDARLISKVDDSWIDIDRELNKNQILGGVQ